MPARAGEASAFEDLQRVVVQVVLADEVEGRVDAGLPRPAALDCRELGPGLIADDGVWAAGPGGEELLLGRG